LFQGYIIAVARSIAAGWRLPGIVGGDTLFQGHIIAVARSLPRVVSSFFRRLFVFIGAQEGFAVLLKEKNQKFKKEGMLPPTGHTPGPPPLSGRPLRFFGCSLGF
jgi:hypothetical protein